MFSVLTLGFVIGMQHALEVDHVAAVASLAARARSLSSVVRHGVFWGLGHTLALLALGAVVIVLGRSLPERLAEILEFAVGVMLVLLGGDVLRRLVRERVHFHLHQHRDGQVHMHAHSHAGERGRHDPDHHEHSHPKGLPVRTLLVGMMHGMAGSAALLLLALASVQSAWTALLYIAVFGAGSVLGMVILSAGLALPLRYSARLFTWSQRALQASIGGVTVLVGGWIIYDIASTTWFSG